MIPDSYEQTVRIPVQWIDGQWQLVGGGPLPEIDTNACADLTLPAFYIKDEQQRERWTGVQTVEFLESGMHLFAAVNVSNVPASLLEKTERKEFRTGGPSCSVRIVLNEKVHLSLTTGKKGALLGGKCVIPSLNESAGSLNEALTKVTRAFEPSRRSVGGNVFLRIFLQQKERFVKLDALRDRATNNAAIGAARPPDRCDTWLELATTLSCVHEVWNKYRIKAVGTPSRDGGPRQRPQLPLPLPPKSDTLLEEAASDFYDYRTHLLIDSDEGLVALIDRFHAPLERSPEIQQLRTFYELMDRAVLAAYGWHDLAETATYEFLLDDEGYGEVGPDAQASRPPRDKKKPYRYRWPDEFRDEVLERLLSLSAERAEHERRQD